jgi:hypothetical protein
MTQTKKENSKDDKTKSFVELEKKLVKVKNRWMNILVYE